MDIELANLAISSVSALSSLIQLYYVKKMSGDNITESNIKAANKRLTEPLKNGGAKLARVMNRDTLKDVLLALESKNQIISETIVNDNITFEEKEVVIDDAKRSICFFIKHMVQLNNGQFPTKRVEKLYFSNDCRSNK